MSIRGTRLLFDDLGFELRPGEVLQIMGANGGGKTTLLRIIAGLTQPEEGDVRWFGRSIFGYGDREARVGDEPGAHPQIDDYREALRYVGHLDGVKVELSTRENLAVHQALFGVVGETRPGPETLGEVGLGDFGEVRAFALSAGQKRRLALARLLVGAPKVWILDEPFTALDRVGVALIEDLIDRHSEAGGAVIFTSHQSLSLDLPRLKSLEFAP
jgi:heme exporter protein A